MSITVDLGSDRKPSARRSRSVLSVGYRTDIDGLRALAIGLVVVYHVWFGRVSGGVDVFLMISAYFMTGSLVRGMVEGRPPRLGGYWISRFRRLLPAAAVTLLGVLVALWAAYPASSWPALWRQTWASLFYIQNWELAASSVDYYARDDGFPSPLQHFWSLSIQGQVFIAWPVLILITGMIARRAGWRVRRCLVILFSVIFVASLAYSVFFTATNQVAAYFDTFARLWEFAIGSLLALAGTRIRLGRTAAAVVGWIGIVGLVSCGLVLDVRGGFPGFLALWPILSAAAIMVAGQVPDTLGPARALSTRPFAWLGRIAYALYLVHWPILVTWMVVTGRSAPGPLAGTAIIVLSVALAVVVTYGIERPIRFSSWSSKSRAHGLVTIILSMAVVAVPLATWQVIESNRAAAVQAERDEVATVDPARTEGAPDADVADILLPLATQLDYEWVALDTECAGEYKPVDPALAGTCQQTVVPGAERLAVIVGDSHAEQWAGAVLPVMADRGWSVVALLNGGCQFALDEPTSMKGCEEWRAAAIEYIQKLRPAMVFAMSTKAVPDDNGERALGGLERTVAALRESGAEVVLIRDNPRFTENIFNCVEAHGAPADVCNREKSAVLAPTDPAAALDLGDARIVDLSTHLCPDGICHAVIGNVIVYLDHNHLTWTFARTLAPALATEIADLW